jgi:hypothetical protein
MAAVGIVASLAGLGISYFNMVSHRNSQPGLADAVAITQFNQLANSGTEVEPLPAAVQEEVKREQTEGHHTVPVYLCGAVVQDPSVIDRKEHNQIHIGLAGVYVIKVFAETWAKKVLFGTHRNPEIVLDLATSVAGRTAIAAAIGFFYQQGNWEAVGAPPIGVVFRKEKVDYIAGKTSLPWCTREKKS